MIILTVEEIIAIHKKIVMVTGGSADLRDRGLLESAVHASEASFGEVDVYPTVIEKSARLAYGLITNHAFVDGNKRIGVFAMLMVLRLNDVKITYRQKELTDLGLGVASGVLSYEDILEWIKKRTSDTSDNFC